MSNESAHVLRVCIYKAFNLSYQVLSCIKLLNVLPAKNKSISYYKPDIFHRISQGLLRKKVGGIVTCKNYFSISKES